MVARLGGVCRGGGRGTRSREFFSKKSRLSAGRGFGAPGFSARRWEENVFSDLKQTFAGMTRNTELERIIAVDLNYSPEDEAFRLRVRQWIARAPAGPLDTLAQKKAWHRKLYEAGFVGMGWPQRVRRPGRAADGAGHRRPRRWRAATCPARSTASALGFIGPTLIAHGTEEQKQRYVQADPDRRGDLVPALLRARLRL